MDWIYFASDEQIPRKATLTTILATHLVWRRARKKNGDLIPNVGNVKAGDRIVVAWREKRSRRTAYLLGEVATPLAPAAPGVVVDRLTGEHADALIRAGYAQEGAVEAIRLSNVVECFFAVKGEYLGNNAIFALAKIDAKVINDATNIPTTAMAEDLPPTRRTRVAPKGSRAARSPKRASPSTPQRPVEGLQIDGSDAPRAFDAYMMIDWSSSSEPVGGNDSIWIASGAWTRDAFLARAPTNHRTRFDAKREIEGTSRKWLADGKRVLVGMDFAFGYPAGFAKSLGIATDGGAWLGIHRHYAAGVHDNDDNAHNRDAFAEECNRRVAPRNAPGPFWGCTTSAASSVLTQQRVGIFSFPYSGLNEWRITDRRAGELAVTQSVWKLNCGVSVGGQTILGIKYLHDLACALYGKRWPFETGWATPSAPEVWFAEIFPSLIRYDEWEAEYASRRDRTQVQSCLRRAAELDAVGGLGAKFRCPEGLDDKAVARVLDEEGWILFT